MEKYAPPDSSGPKDGEIEIGRGDWDGAPDSSRISVRGRPVIIDEICAIIAQENIQDALTDSLLMNGATGTAIDCIGDEDEFRAEVEKGIRALCRCSGDLRLQTTHYMLHMLLPEEGATSCAGMLMGEIECAPEEVEDGEDAKIVKKVFGLSDD